jgi:hypothetical protein
MMEVVHRVVVAVEALELLDKMQQVDKFQTVEMD